MVLMIVIEIDGDREQRAVGVDWYQYSKSVRTLALSA